MKKIIFGFIIASFIFGASEAFAEDLVIVPSGQKILINNVETPLSAYNIDGRNYFQLAALGDAIGLDYSYDSAQNAVIINTLTDGAVVYGATWYKAELDNYSPKKNEEVTLTVSSGDGRVLDYTATFHYKTKVSVYDGKTNQPQNIKTGTATEDYTVIIDVAVKDGENVYRLMTSFTPLKS
jgi:hypothetical protein